MAKIVELEMNLNGEQIRVNTEPTATLAQVLRERLGLTGTKIGCGEGICGACTVLVDGSPVNSCIYAAIKAAGRHVQTVEGLSHDGELHSLQRAFLDKGAVQCGYCTPGLLLTAAALLKDNPHPTESEIRSAISGNLCRCTGYTKIIKAIQAASRSGTKSAT
jgi:carbon-monoxide dehydrogenase small subunit